MNRIKDINSLSEDQSFIDYVLGNNNVSTNFWEEYIMQYPEDEEELEKIKQIILFLDSGKKQLPFNKASYELKKLNSSIDFHEKKNVALSERKTSSKQGEFQLWLKIAAVFILFFSLTAVLLKTEILPYHITKSISPEDIPQNQIIVPLGEKSHVILCDGTEIWLNSGSKLTYPNNFDNGQRIVKLEGEAYFHVTKNEHQPFVVKTDKIDVEVLGTSFNLKSYPEEDLVETTLIEGSVKLIREDKGRKNIFYLKPKEKAAFSSVENKMRIYKIQDNISDQTAKNTDITEKELLKKKKSIKPDIIESIVSWKDQILIFNSENLLEIATKLERWYGCEIVLNDTVDVIKGTYTGKFIHNEPITMVLDVIKATTPITYEIIDNKVMINKVK